MAQAKKCDRCGVFFEGNQSYKYNDGEQEFIVNSFRVGNWDQRRKCWRSIASGYDLCPKCGQAVVDVIMGGENNQIQMRKVEVHKNYNSDNMPPIVLQDESEVEGDDGR